MRSYRTLFVLLLSQTMCLAGENVYASSGGQDIKIANVQSESSLSVFFNPRLALTLPDVDGASHKLSEWQGKIIVLNFWASWCFPCQYEIRDLVAWQDKYNSQGLQIIGVGIDEVQKLRNVMRTLEINYPVLVADPANYPKVMEVWGNRVGTVPHTVVIGRDGRVVYIHRGLVSEETFLENVLPLLENSVRSDSESGKFH